MSYSTEISILQSFSFNLYTNMICGDCSTLTIDDQGNVYCFGRNSVGKFGLPSEGYSNSVVLPTKIPNICNIKMVSSGYDHTVCLDYLGNIYTFGSNSKGQLGCNNYENTTIPQQINLPFINKIASGAFFTVCLSDDNELYSFGDNAYGQLGIGNNCSKKSEPVKISDLSNVEFIECFSYSVICKTYDNKLYSWGNNSHGQLGQQTLGRVDKPKLCKKYPDNIISIKCGVHHMIALANNGKVYGCGSNSSGQLGMGNTRTKPTIFTLIDNIPDIQKIECGYNYSMCLDIDYNLWVFGDNTSGQLGLGDKKYRYTPVKNDLLHDIIDISHGGNHAFAKKSTGEVYAFGNNCNNQLSIKNKTSIVTPKQIFIDNDNLWVLNKRSRAKSARK